MTATLIACAHGTHSHAGRATIDALRSRIALLLPDVTVAEAYVDVQEPAVDAVVEARGSGEAVIVPLLLSTGFHTVVYLPRAAGDYVAVARPLGPHPLLADVLIDRVRAAGAVSTWPLVIAAAGSSDARAAVDVEATRALVAQAWDGPVTVGYVSAMSPRVGDAVARARGDGGPVAVATYLLAPGYFADLVAQAGGDLTGAPLGDDARVAEVARQRYVAAVGSASSSGVVGSPAAEPSTAASGASVTDAG